VEFDVVPMSMTACYSIPHCALAFLGNQRSVAHLQHAHNTDWPHIGGKQHLAVLLELHIVGYALARGIKAARASFCPRGVPSSLLVAHDSMTPSFHTVGCESACGVRKLTLPDGLP